MDVLKLKEIIKHEFQKFLRKNHFRIPIRYKENGEINAGIIDKESTRKN